MYNMNSIARTALDQRCAPGLIRLLFLGAGRLRANGLGEPLVFVGVRDRGPENAWQEKVRASWGRFGVT